VVQTLALASIGSSAKALVLMAKGISSRTAINFARMAGITGNLAQVFLM
jgi:hypothetical protein